MIPTGNTKSGVRIFNNRIVAGIDTEYVIETDNFVTGEKDFKHVWWLKPLYQRPRNRSRYMPHQGKQEMARRAARGH